MIDEPITYSTKGFGLTLTYRHGDDSGDVITGKGRHSALWDVSSQAVQCCYRELTVSMSWVVIRCNSSAVSEYEPCFKLVNVYVVLSCTSGCVFLLVEGLQCGRLCVSVCVSLQVILYSSTITFTKEVVFSPFVSKITQKLLDRFQRNFVEGCGMSQERRKEGFLLRDRMFFFFHWSQGAMNGSWWK